MLLTAAFFGTFFLVSTNEYVFLVSHRFNKQKINGVYDPSILLHNAPKSSGCLKPPIDQPIPSSGGYLLCHSQEPRVLANDFTLMSEAPRFSSSSPPFFSLLFFTSREDSIPERVNISYRIHFSRTFAA
jgi:hypothetical protein